MIVAPGHTASASAAVTLASFFLEVPGWGTVVTAEIEVLAVLAVPREGVSEKISLARLSQSVMVAHTFIARFGLFELGVDEVLHGRATGLACAADFFGFDPPFIDKPIKSGLHRFVTCQIPPLVSSHVAGREFVG